MKNTILFTIIGAILFAWLLRVVITWQWWNRYFFFGQDTVIVSDSRQKLYIAHEWESSVAVIDTESKKLTKSISLTQQYYGKLLKYSAHNVQVSPQGTIIAVTANIQEDADDVHGGEMVNSDELILIDPQTDSIVWRIDLWVWSHLAHVVIDPTDTIAYIASQEKWIIFIVDLKTQTIQQEVTLLDGSQPHGMRLSPDGKNLFIALIGEKAIGIMDTSTFTIEYIPVGDKVVQVAVTPDGRYVFASLYMTRSIARYDLTNKQLASIPLPDGAKWPVQIYPTPDSRFLYIADQWFYLDQATSDQIYVIDIDTKQIMKNYTGWQAPHGVVVSPDGKYAYITNLLSDTVSVIDTSVQKPIDTITVGKKPNGISIRTQWEGGTP